MAQAHRTRAEQVPGGREAGVDAAQAQRALGRHHHKTLDGSQRVGACVQRQRLDVLRVAVAVGAARVFLLQVGAVQQQHLGQVARGGGGVDGAFVSVFDEGGQVAAVVKMGVAQQHGVGLEHGWRRRRPVALAVHLEALEEAAVEQDALPADVDQMPRAGDAVGGTQKLNLHAPSSCSSPEFTMRVPGAAWRKAARMPRATVAA